MYAIIETGGKQYKVQNGDQLRVEKLNAEAGSTVVFDMEEVRDIAALAFGGICSKLNINGDYLGVCGVCIGTGVGELNYYYSRPTGENDLHGVGAFLLMACEYAEIFE